jgi:hypothetical protein
MNKIPIALLTLNQNIRSMSLISLKIEIRVFTSLNQLHQKGLQTSAFDTTF